MLLTKASREFILHWGEMGTRWGVNRTVAQVHALAANASTLTTDKAGANGTTTVTAVSSAIAQCP